MKPGGERGNKALPAITLVFLSLLLAQASVLVYNPMYSTTIPQDPPVVFDYPPAAPTVTVELGANKTNASVLLNLTGAASKTLILDYRSAVYWDDFDTDPFADGRMYVKNPDPACTWYWENGYIGVNSTGLAATEGGECIALVNKTIDYNDTVYVSTFYRVLGLGYIDSIFYSDPATSNAPYYAEGYYRGRRGAGNATIDYYNGADWINLNFTAFGNIARNVWYDLTGARNDVTGWLAVFNATNLEASAYDTSTNVTAVGVGSWYVRYAIGTPYYTVYFDKLLVTVKHPPYYVNVTGLQAGWYVVIRDSQGNVLADGVANGSTLVLEAWQWKMAANATIEVYNDTTAAELVASATFPWVLGGDRFLVSDAARTAVDVLSIVNVDGGNGYYVGLRLLNYTIVAGDFGNVSLWVESPAGNTSRIEIIGGVLFSGPETSSVYLDPGSQASLLVWVEAVAGSEMILSLIVYYEVGGVRVEYPVELRVLA